MAIITSYSTLQSELKDEMDRSDDSSSPWTRFIDQAESRMRRDKRIRRRVATNLSADAETASLPSGFAEPDGLSHDGPTYFHAVDTVSSAELSRAKAWYGTPGVPVKAMYIDGQTVKFAPVPDQTYTLNLTYYETVTKLGGAVLSNWLLEDHPDLYLSACVVEAAKYFRDAEKRDEAQLDMDRRIEELHRDTQRREYAGTMTRTPADPIG